MDQIILTKESFLQFVDKNYNEDGGANQESMMENDTNIVVEEDTIGSTSIKKDDINTQIGNNRIQESVLKRDNDAPTAAIGARNSKLEAIKKVVMRNKKKKTKLKLPKGKKQKNDSLRNKPLRQISRLTLRSNVPKTTL